MTMIYKSVCAIQDFKVADRYNTNGPPWNLYRIKKQSVSRGNFRGIQIGYGCDD